LEDEAQPEEFLSRASAAGIAEEKKTQGRRLGGPETVVEAGWSLA
jgi:hypothetical protein